MATVAGLVLGAAPLIVPIYKGYKRCAELLQDILHPTEDLKLYTVKFIAQKTFFEIECELLLSSAVGNETAKMMLNCEQHPQWTDQEFVTWWSVNISDPVEMALTTSKEAIVDVFERLEKGRGSMKTSLVSSTHTSSSNHIQNFINESRAAKRSMKCRFDWAIAGKSRVKELLSTLKQQNRDLRRLRKQSLELRKIRRQNSLNPTVSFPKIESLPVRDERTTTWVFAIRELAAHLHEGLALTAACSCHNVHLRLEDIPHRQNAKINSTNRTSFRLVICPETLHACADDGYECICLHVQSEWMETEDSKMLSTTTQHASARSGSKRKASDKFSSDKIYPKKTNQSLQLTSKSSIVANAPPSLKSDSEMPSALVNITNLCSALKSEGRRSQSSHCLGSIKNTKNVSCQHLLYIEPNSYQPSSRLSLSTLLSASGKQHLPPPSERLRMASILALSTLQFGSLSSSWFQEHWRSGDIFFFLDQRVSNGCNGGVAKPSSLSLVPHISALFGPSRRRRKVARNSLLFSLALVLSEIAFGETLSKIPSPNGIPESAGEDPILEYLKLQEIVDTKRLEGQVSRKYAKVVERCFYCDFALGDDFTKKDLQEVFYRDVVEKLQECVKVLDEY
ncbi:hypothetical protein BDD12DRAFT_935178 [Trichophaea hybrida]|nr:hypothetical protein BDD12DRAFT_935178 [Trichophaea hybrida]